MKSLGGRGLKAAESSSNDGRHTESMGKQRWSVDYGKDHSSVVGSASNERSISMGGGVDNISHSISSGKANQRGS
jgi:hypothetical protein